MCKVGSTSQKKLQWGWQKGSSGTKAKRLEKQRKKKSNVVRQSSPFSNMFPNLKCQHLQYNTMKRLQESWKIMSRLKIIIVLGKHGPCILQTKEERDHPAYYQCSFPKACISDTGTGEHWHLWNWQLPPVEKHHQWWKVYTGFVATYVPI